MKMKLWTRMMMVGGNVDLLAMLSSLGGRYGPNGYNHNVYMGNGQFAEYQWGLSDSD